ncbi:MAG: dynamin family protein [Planctomycetaceae bacterium]
MSQLTDYLVEAIATLETVQVPGRFLSELDRLAREAQQPCLLAVVGRMKAGKSTFINALLGEDLAKVGVDETTATINRFVYGTPDHPDRPVRCWYRGGRYEDQPLDFLNSLQGHSAEALSRAADIEYLEYRLPSPFLRDVTLVDTPGMNAAVSEHVQRTAELLALRKQLAERHEEATQRLGSQADAIVYLIGSVARTNDEAFLNEFRQVTGSGSRALNAVGVLGKVDLQPEILARRHELAAKIAHQFRDNLNTVVPISAGLHRAIESLGNEGLQRLIQAVRQIPAARLSKLLSDEQLWCEAESTDCPLSPDERRELLGRLDWSVFVTLVRQTCETADDGTSLTAKLRDLSGFEPLKEVLERQFFRRSRFLREHGVAVRVALVLNSLQRELLPSLRKQDRQTAQQHARFQALLSKVRFDAETTSELRGFIDQQLGQSGRSERLAEALSQLACGLGRIQQRLSEENADFEALQKLETETDVLPPTEHSELKRLFGQFGAELHDRVELTTASHLVARQQFWRSQTVGTRTQTRRELAERAASRYGLLLAEIVQA